MKDFIKFPHTPHLFWLASEAPRADKVLTPPEAVAFLDGEVVVEEKVDGANIGLSIDARGALQAQDRGEYLGRGSHPQFQPLWAWLEARRASLAAALRQDLVAFGEWCFATHSVSYSRLPDWFLGFDVFDRAGGVFWPTSRRDALFEALGIAIVPRLGCGRFDREGLLKLLSRSQLGDAPMEGLYVRKEDSRGLIARAKVVRPEFVESMEQHWRDQPLRRNRRVGDAEPFRRAIPPARDGSQN